MENTLNCSKGEETENTFNMRAISARPEGNLAIINMFSRLKCQTGCCIAVETRVACQCSEGHGSDLWLITMFSTPTGRSIRRVFPRLTPSSCSSASSRTQPPRLLISGRLPTKTTTPRSGSPSTVSLALHFGSQLERNVVVAISTYTQL